MNIWRSSAIYSVQNHFSEIYENQNPLVQLSQNQEKHKKSKKIRILKKKWHLFWKHNWKQVNFSDQKWEFTCFWWTQMLLNGEKTENGVCKYGLLQVMKAIEESTSWFGQSEKKKSKLEHLLGPPPLRSSHLIKFSPNSNNKILSRKKMKIFLKC